MPRDDILPFKKKTKNKNYLIFQFEYQQNLMIKIIKKGIKQHLKNRTIDSFINKN